MRLNSLKPAVGAKQAPKRLGRGIGSGLGKTSGKGHKGQHARAGGFHKLGFEGGQMPMQRRLPKFGFTSKKAQQWLRLRLSDLERIPVSDIDFDVLAQMGLIPNKVKYVKVYASGELTKAVNLKGIHVSSGARKLIESVGGKVE
jgi:large subunit ribosomal protein L15